MAVDFKDEILGLYRACFHEVYRYCAYRLYSKELAEDAAQAVFLRLVEEYPTLHNRSEDKIRSWLFGTASNVAASYLRDGARQARIAKALTAGRQEYAAPPPAEVRADWPAVYRAIARLQPRDQAIIVLRYFQDMESPAIAEALGMARVTVRVRLSRAIKTLRRELAGEVL